MALKIRQKLKHKTPFNHMVLPQAILLNSCYSIFLRNWLKYFPKEQIHLVNGNEISKLLKSEITKPSTNFYRSKFIFNRKPLYVRSHFSLPSELFWLWFITNEFEAHLLIDLYFSRKSSKSNDGCREFCRSRKMVHGRQFCCQPGNWIFLHQAAAKGCRTSLLNWWWKGANSISQI